MEERKKKIITEEFDWENNNIHRYLGRPDEKFLNKSINEWLDQNPDYTIHSIIPIMSATQEENDGFGSYYYHYKGKVLAIFKLLKEKE